jgi:hypothetical protein
MEDIEKDVKQIIIDISQLDRNVEELDNDSSLSDLNFNDNMCRVLVQRLNKFLADNGCSDKLSTSDIDPDTTIGEVLDAINEKINPAGL